MKHIFAMSVGFVGLFGIAAMAACSASDSDSDALGTVEQFCQARAENECVVAPKCAATTDACLAARKSVCAADAKAAQSSGRVYTSSLARACLDKTKELYDRGSASPTEMTELEETCGRVFQGTIEQNKPCTTDFECKDQLICDKGFCATENEKKSGEPCANPGDICERGSYCTNNGSLFVCASKKGAGEVCRDDSSPCSEDYRCNGLCVSRFGPGESCEVGRDQCASSAPYCDPTVLKCTAGVGFTAGAPICKDYGAN